jgi:hypothetical protein
MESMNPFCSSPAVFTWGCHTACQKLHAKPQSGRGDRLRRKVFRIGFRDGDGLDAAA